MTQHLNHGSIPNFVERNPARHNQTMREASSYRLLADPIEFSQNIGRTIMVGLLDDLLIRDAPKQVDDLRMEFEFLIEGALDRGNLPAAVDCFTEYCAFVTYALCEAREYGVALGAVIEQLRIGLVAVVDLSNRGLVFGDMQSHNDLQRLQRKHDLPLSSSYGETDYATIKEEPAGAEAA